MTHSADQMHRSLVREMSLDRNSQQSLRWQDHPCDLVINPESKLLSPSMIVLHLVNAFGHAPNYLKLNPLDDLCFG